MSVKTNERIEGLSKAVIDRLKLNGVKYVRWTFRGSYGEGGIVEIKLFDAASTELEDLPILASDGAAGKLQDELMRLGEILLEKECSGFEKNDGGYGWILLDAEQDSYLVKQEYNQNGMDYDYFDEERYDRIRFDVADEASEFVDPLDMILVTYARQSDAQITELVIKNKKAFMTWEHMPKKRVRYGTSSMTHDAHTLFKINGQALAGVLGNLKIPASEKLYYKTDSDFSHSPVESLSEITLSVDGDSWGETVATVFLNGWNDDFHYKRPGEEEVIKFDPMPTDLLDQE